jgi:hypothetical protein
MVRQRDVLPGEWKEDGAGMVGLGAEYHGVLLQPQHRVEDEHVVRVHCTKKTSLFCWAKKFSFKCPQQFRRRKNNHAISNSE